MAFTPSGTPGGHDTIGSVAPQPHAYSLLSVARPLPTLPNQAQSTDGLPLGGVRLPHSRCVSTGTWPTCPPVDEDDKADQGTDTTYPFYPVGWYRPVGCDNTSANFDQWYTWAAEDVAAASAWAVERYVWSEASIAATVGARFTSPSLMTVASTVSGTHNPRDGIALLLQAYKACNRAGGQAVLHIPPDLAPYLLDRGVIAQAGSKMVGPTGQDVAVGAGYNVRQGPYDSGADGTLETLPAVWIAISGPIFVGLGTVFEAANPSGLTGVMIEGRANPRRNDQQVIAERRATFAFDTCCVYAVKVSIPDVAVASVTA